MKTAIVILALGDYWKGAKVMFHTLRKYGNLPDWVDTIALGHDRPLTMDWSDIPVHQTNFPKVAAKFEALTLGYDRTILLDADMLCLSDCSLLWSDELTLPFYGVRDLATGVYYGPVLKKLGLNLALNFNGGTMVFNGFDLDGFLKAVSGGLQSYDGGDQGYLNAYFQLVRPDLKVGYLPTAYNCVLDKNFEQVPDSEKRIVHFTGSNANPWDPNVPKRDDRIRFLKRWQQEWSEVCE